MNCHNCYQCQKLEGSASNDMFEHQSANLDAQLQQPSHIYVLGDMTLLLALFQQIGCYTTEQTVIRVANTAEGISGAAVNEIGKPGGQPCTQGTPGDTDIPGMFDRSHSDLPAFLAALTL